MTNEVFKQLPRVVLHLRDFVTKNLTYETSTGYFLQLTAQSKF